MKILEGIINFIGIIAFVIVLLALICIVLGISLITNLLQLIFSFFALKVVYIMGTIMFLL